MQTGTLTLARDDDQVVGITLTNSDGTAYDLTGCSFVFIARHPIYSSEIVLQQTVTDHLDPTAGLSQFTFVPADTAALGQPTYFFTVRLLSAAGKWTTLMKGDLLIVPN